MWKNDPVKNGHPLLNTFRHRPTYTVPLRDVLLPPNLRSAIHQTGKDQFSYRKPTTSEERREALTTLAKDSANQKSILALLPKNAFDTFKAQEKQHKSGDASPAESEASSETDQDALIKMIQEGLTDSQVKDILAFRVSPPRSEASEDGFEHIRSKDHSLQDSPWLSVHGTPDKMSRVPSTNHFLWPVQEAPVEEQPKDEQKPHHAKKSSATVKP